MTALRAQYPVSSVLTLADTYQEFVRACRGQVASADGFAVNHDKLLALTGEVAGAKPIAWSWYLPEGEIMPTAAFFEFCLNAALNGGYFALDAAGGIVQWQVGGSGSQALVEWLTVLREAQEFPGVNLRTPAAVRLVLAERVQGQPHAAQRLDILAAFADRDVRAGLDDVMADAWTGKGYHFTFEHADRLARLVPAGFGNDPFRKKACLALQMTAGYLWHTAKDLAITTEIPIPSDYQIPRILHWKGAITIPDRFAEALTSGEMLDVTSDDVMSFRAAAVVACSELARLAGVEDGIVDGALFTKFRKDQDFKQNALPPMRCASMWF